MLVFPCRVSWPPGQDDGEGLPVPQLTAGQVQQGPHGCHHLWGEENKLIVRTLVVYWYTGILLYLGMHCYTAVPWGKLVYRYSSILLYLLVYCHTAVPSGMLASSKESGSLSGRISSISRGLCSNVQDCTMLSRMGL